MSRHAPVGADSAPTAGARPIQVEWLGRVPYGRAAEMQGELVIARRSGRIPDRLLLLEHPHVITLGSSAKAQHILIDEAERALLGIDRHESGRGGDVTYHGPGQLIGYPILALRGDRRDLHRYVRDLEEVLIRAIAEFGIAGGRSAGRTGVWVEERKIAAIGVRVSSGWITSHGFALNVDPDLRFFETIVPCGLHGAAVTSMRQCTGRTVDASAVRDAVVAHFGHVFEAQPGKLRRTHPEGLVEPAASRT